MESYAGYNAINFSHVANSSRNTTVMFSKVSSYLCPSDLPAPTEVVAGVSEPWAQGSYGMSRGTQENIYENWAKSAFPDPNQPQPDKCNAPLGNGMFGAEDVVKVSGVIDGTSNTTLFGEMSRFIDDPATKYNAWYFTAAFSTTYTGGYWPPNEVRIQTGAFTYPDMNGPPDRTSQYYGMVFCNCGSKACIPSDWLDPNCMAAVRKLGQFAFQSHHPGGCNFAFGDGSVRFIKQTINTVTYMALGTRAGNEVLSSDSY